MKLRNKKTGELGQIGYVATSGGEIIVEDISGDEYPYSVISSYKTLAELNEEWEDYEPKEPLIKDEKIRKAVRAWAEANKEEELEVMGGCSVTAFKSLYNHTEIDFNCSWKLRDSVYTIEELCGEEKE